MKYLIVNTESFSAGIPGEVKEFLEKNNGEVFIVLDESSKIKSNQPSKGSKRTKNLMMLNSIGERCILTGTFMSKSPMNAYNQMNFLKSGYFDENQYQFFNTYVMTMKLPNVSGARISISRPVYDRLKSAKTQSGVSSILSYYGISYSDYDELMNKGKYTPFRNVDRIWERIKDDVMVVDKNTALDMPKKLYRSIKIPISPKVKELYNKTLEGENPDIISMPSIGLPMFYVLQDICNGYEPYTDGSTRITQTGQVSFVIKTREMEHMEKIEVLKEVLDEIDTEAHQVVIWANRINILNKAYKELEALEYSVAKYDSFTAPSDKERIRQSFLNGECRVFVCNQKTGAYGIDFLKDADYEIFLSNDYSVETRFQAEDRFHRLGCKNNKIVIDISIEGSVEDVVVDALKQGEELLNSKVTIDFFRLRSSK